MKGVVGARSKTSIDVMDQRKELLMKPLDIPGLREGFGIFRNIEHQYGETGSLIDVPSGISLTELMNEREAKKYPPQYAKIDNSNRRKVVLTKNQKKKLAYHKSAEITRYMRKHYEVEHTPAGRQSSMIDMAYRIVEKSCHVPQLKDWFNQRAERRLVEYSGMLSDITKPYLSVGEIEADIDMLIFHNLPNEVKIDAAEWIKIQFEKAEEKRRHETELPSCSHYKAMRPKVGGKMKKNPGGLEFPDKVAKVGQLFEKEIKGSMTFEKSIANHIHRMEIEAAKSANAFGLLQRKTTEGLTEDELEVQKRLDELMEIELSKLTKDKTYLKEMELFEKMLHAVHEIIKTLLNIKPIQIKAKVPIPIPIVKMYRSKSPRGKKLDKTMPSFIAKRQVEREANKIAAENKAKDQEEQRKAAKQKKAIQTAAKRDPKSLAKIMSKKISAHPIKSTNKPTASKSKVMIQSGKHPQSLVTKDVDETPIVQKSDSEMAFDDWVKQTLSYISNPQLEEKLSKILTQVKVYEKPVIPQSGLVPNRALPDVNLRVKDIMNMYSLKSKKSSAKIERILTTVMKIVDSSGYLRIEPLETSLPLGDKESASEAVKRLEKANLRFKTLFGDKDTGIRPIWHDIEINKDLRATEKRQSFKVNMAEVQSSTAVELEEFMPKKSSLGREFDIPVINEIPTPQIPSYLNIEDKINAEDESRLDLLNRIPTGSDNFDIPTPIQRLNNKAGVEFTHKNMFEDLMEIKMVFNEKEKKVQIDYEQKVDKFEWETPIRYFERINRNIESPIYARSLAALRKTVHTYQYIGGRRPEKWYTELVLLFNEKLAQGCPSCVQLLEKIQKYCDVGPLTKKKMVNRLILTAVSFPAIDILTVPVQKAFIFIMHYMFKIQPAKLEDWLKVRGIPYLLDSLPNKEERRDSMGEPTNTARIFDF